MTIPCDQAATIEKLMSTQDGMEIRQRIQSEHVAVIKDNVEKLNRGFESFTSEMRTLMTDVQKGQVKHGEQIAQLTKETEILFQGNRDVKKNIADVKEDLVDRIDRVKNATSVRIGDIEENRIKPIEDSHLKEQGMTKALIAVPSVLATILALIGIYSFLTL